MRQARHSLDYEPMAPPRRHYPTSMMLSATRRYGPILAGWLASAVTLYGWSDQGHRVVALAAQENLSENAKRRIGYLLGKDAFLVDVATWADSLISERPETEAWHSIAIPPNVEGIDLKRDCPLGDCVTAKVRECIGVVRLAIRRRDEIVDAFKMLVGLAADMHQPLLNGYPPAHGKEGSIVVLDGAEMPLFDAWDKGLLSHMGSEEQILERVRRRIADADKEIWTRGTYRSWTWETHRLATERVYPSVSGSDKTVLEGPSLDAASEIVVDQLAKSAVRLAHMLDIAWP